MGKAGESLDFHGFSGPTERDVPVLFCLSNPVDKSVICRIGTESLPLESCKLREERVEIMLGGPLEALDVKQVGVRDYRRLPFADAATGNQAVAADVAGPVKLPR
jgi:hypothetical protein